MTFNFSQSLVEDITYPGSLSQELVDSQDSGYGVHTNHLPPAPFPFPPRRTLPRPPTWPNLAQPQQGGGKWRFGGRQKVMRSPLERDLQQHLTEMSKAVHNMPRKVSTIVEESVKYLQKVYSKEAEDVEDEMNVTKQAVVELREKVMDKDSVPEDLTEKMIAMGKVLSECNALATVVTDKEKRMKDRLAGLLLQLDREISCTRVLVDKVSRVERETSDSQMRSMARAMVMKEMQTKMSDGLVQQQVQQVPHMTPPPLTIQAMEVQTVMKKGMLGGQKGERDYGRSWRRVRERRVLLEE